jgi:CRISPR-associated protein (Cas_Cas02710)
MASEDRFKLNYDLLQEQQKQFTSSGVLLRNLFSISAIHPILSVAFVLSFGVLVNSTYDFLSYPILSTDFVKSAFILRAGLVAIFGLLSILIVVHVKTLHKDLFSNEPLNRKKLLITLVSKGRNDFKDTPSYNTYESLLYGTNGQAAINSLEKVILVTTELPEVLKSAEDLKVHIESSSRTAEIYRIAIDNKSIVDIQKQMKLLLAKFTQEYKPHEIVADYTGGTKEMSIALFKASEVELVMPAYLKEATDGNHTKYS